MEFLEGLCCVLPGDALEDYKFLIIYSLTKYFCGVPWRSGGLLFAPPGCVVWNSVILYTSPDMMIQMLSLGMLCAAISVRVNESGIVNFPALESEFERSDIY